MKKQPHLILCAAFVLGIFLQDFFHLADYWIDIFLIVSFLSLFVFLVRNFYFHKFRNISLILFFFSVGIFAHSLKMKKPDLPQLQGKEFIYFKINGKLNSNEKNRRYEISAWKNKEPFQSVLSMPKEKQELDFNHYYKADAYVNRIQKPYSDFQFDYGKYLSRRGIYFQSYLPNSYQKGKRNDLTFAEKIRQKRLETLAKIDRTNLSKRTREFTKGIILADRTEMDKETVQDFSKSGLMHILAISGSHMAIIFWLILLVLNPIFPPKFRNFKIVISLVLIWAFAIFIDYGSSVVRSCIMISCYYVYVLLQRKTDLLHAMAVAAFGILIYDTNQLYDVGFQLSFAAVFGIFWLNQPILKYLPKPRNRFQDFMVNVVSISFAAQIATLPLVIFYFHQWSFISIPANLVIIPIAEILIIFALLMTVLIAFSVGCDWLNLIYDFVVNWTLKTIHFFADTDFAFHKMIPMTLLEVGVGFIVVYFLRFAILNFNIKNVSRLVYFLLLFIALRIMLNYRAARLDEVLGHQYFKERIISIKNKDRVQFLVPEGLDLEKLSTYVMEPYLTSRRTTNFEVKKIPANVEHIDINGKRYYLKQKN